MADTRLIPEALEWPLVGREPELARIAELRALGRCPGVVIRAAAGVGKSSLARHALAQAKVEGASTAWVQATRSAATVPLAALAALIDDDGGHGQPAGADAADGRAHARARRRPPGRPRRRRRAAARPGVRRADPAARARRGRVRDRDAADRRGVSGRRAVAVEGRGRGAAGARAVRRARHRPADRVGARRAGGGGGAALGAGLQPRQRALRPRAPAGRARRRVARGPPGLLAARPPPGAEPVARRHHHRAAGRARAGREADARAARARGAAAPAGARDARRP